MIQAKAFMKYQAIFLLSKKAILQMFPLAPKAMPFSAKMPQGYLDWYTNHGTKGSHPKTKLPQGYLNWHTNHGAKGSHPKIFASWILFRMD
jgi:hypothetical protein